LLLFELGVELLCIRQDCLFVFESWRETLLRRHSRHRLHLGRYRREFALELLLIAASELQVATVQLLVGVRCLDTFLLQFWAALLSNDRRRGCVWSLSL